MHALWRNGDRIQLHPATDAWMRGDRFGEVVATEERHGRIIYRVLMDRSTRVLRVKAGDVLEGVE